jgi:predicted small metal-binding protein
MRTLACREAGFDCDYTMRGDTEDDVMRQGKEHAIKEHGMTEKNFTPEFMEKVKGLIREV